MPQVKKVLLGIMELVEAKRLRDKLQAMGIDVVLGHNKETCTKGCKVTVELWANPEDVQAIQETLQAERAKLLSDFDVDPERANQVFDPNEESAICPACGTQFATTLNECPECGLVFK